MTQFYRLSNPELSSISVDGIEHKVNPDNGLLAVEVMTPGLVKELKDQKATLVDPLKVPPALSSQERRERESLLEEIQEATGRPVDRRKSLPQLRALKASIDDKAKAAAG